MFRSWLSRVIAGASLLASGFVCAAPLPHAAASPWTACYVELRNAAEQYGVPYRILEAVASAESGREGNGFLWPWPWTVNVAGKARFFSLRQEAVQQARQAIERGELNVDIGCMQLNWRYHGSGFKDPDAALEPITNVRYAAKLLAQEYRASGTWADAVSRYHSRQARHAADYRCLVARRLRPLPPLPQDCDSKTGRAKHH